MLSVVGYKAYDHTYCYIVFSHISPHSQEQFKNLAIGIKLPHLVTSLRAHGGTEEVGAV